MSEIFTLTRQTVSVQFSPLVQGYAEPERMDVVTWYAMDGTRYDYIRSVKRAWTIPVAGINEANATTINQWWANKYPLTLTIGSSNYTVVIANVEKPLNRMPLGQWNNAFYEGIIELEEI